MARNCEHKSKKVITVEDVPVAFAATITNTTYEMTYERKDCGEKWTGTKVDTKFSSFSSSSTI